MKRIFKKSMAVVIYMLFLCLLLKTEVILLFSPKHIGMFLLGCILLCIPYVEKRMKWRELESIFKKNAIIAGYLESFMLIFVSMLQKREVWEELLAQLALGLRPVFYGFVCYVILKDEPTDQISKGDKAPLEGDEAPSKGDKAFLGENEKFPETDEMQSVKKELDFSKLTRQEKQVAEFAKRGMTNREIGEELCISEATVKKHMSNIFEKLEIGSRKELR